MLGFRPEKFLVYSCWILLPLWSSYKLAGNGRKKNNSLKSTTAYPSSFLFSRILVHVEGLQTSRNQKSQLHHHRHHHHQHHHHHQQQQQQSVRPTNRITTSISATQKSAEGFVIPQVTLSKDRFRFRNLTRSIEYSVVSGHDDQNKGTEDSFDSSEHYAKSIVVDTNEHDSNSANRQPRCLPRAEHVLFRGPTKIDFDVCRKIIPAVVGNSPEIVEPGFGNHDERSDSPATVVSRSRRRRASTVRLTNPIILWHLMARSYMSLVRKLSSLGKMFLYLFGMRLAGTSGGATVTASTVGFSEADLGGRKRHYALLVASALSGSGCLAGARCGTSVGVGMFGAPWFDPLAYHHNIVRSAHHRTVASLSPSALSKYTEGLSDLLWIDDTNLTLPVSALQTHARRWMGQQRRKQQNQQM